MIEFYSVCASSHSRSHQLTVIAFQHIAFLCNVSFSHPKNRNRHTRIAAGLQISVWSHKNDDQKCKQIQRGTIGDRRLYCIIFGKFPNTLASVRWICRHWVSARTHNTNLFTVEQPTHVHECAMRMRIRLCVVRAMWSRCRRTHEMIELRLTAEHTNRHY